MRTWITGVAVLATALAATAAAVSGPQMTPDRLSHDFGDIKAGEVVEARFSVLNSGDVPLVIDEVRTSCGCTAAVAGSREIPPGGATDITVSYDSGGLTSGRKTQSVIVHSNDPKNPLLKLQVFANVVHQLSLEPATLVLRLPRFEEHVTCRVTARNNSKQPVSLMMSSTQGGIARAVLESDKVLVQPESETRFQVQVDLKRPETGKIVYGEMVFSSDHPAVKQLPLRCVVKVDGDL